MQTQTSKYALVLDELKTILALLGARRVPALEEYIFNNASLSEYYLRILSTDKYWYTIEDNVVDMAYWYAHYTLRDRWPAVEKIIAFHPYYWPSYKSHFKIENPGQK